MVTIQLDKDEIFLVRLCIQNTIQHIISINYDKEDKEKIEKSINDLFELGDKFGGVTID